MYRCPQACLASKDKLAATQLQTIARLEATIREQQADIRSALDLVSSSRPSVGSAAAAAEGGLDAGYYGGMEEVGGGGLLGAGDAAAGGMNDGSAAWPAGWGGLGGDSGDGGALHAWASDVFDREDAPDWSIPAAGRTGGWLGSSTPASPAKPAAPDRQLPCGSGGQSLGGSADACPGLGLLESDIAGLEAALRTALGDLSL
jgi:hypothetical protein